MSPQEAIEAPRWTSGGADPRQLTVEPGFPEEALAALAARGHQIVRTGKWDIRFGHAQMILRDPASGLVSGGADPRADGVAIGY
jgi:gamma-glutamyltranspeptidase/glutathione hydrolase